MARKRRYLDDTPVNLDVSKYINKPFTVNGITYATIPSRYTKGKIANSRTKEDTNASNVYVKQGADGKWYQTRMDKDAANINYHLNQQDIVNRSNEIIDNQWRQGDGETIRVNQGDAKARQQWFSNEDATKFLLTTTGLGALGAGVVSAPLATTLGFAGGYGGGKLVDKGMQLGTGKTWREWISNKTGLPEWFTEFTNPGAIVGGGFGIKSKSFFNKYMNNKYSLYNVIPNRSSNMTLPHSVYYNMIKQKIFQNPHLYNTHLNALDKELSIGANHILKYLGSDKHIRQIMKSGVSKQEATAIAKQMLENAKRSKLNVDDVGDEALGNFNNNWTMENGKLIANPTHTMNKFGNPDLARNAIIHEMNHAATMGYSPIISGGNAKTVYNANQMLNEGMERYFPLYEQVYKHNLSLKPKLKSNWKSKIDSGNISDNDLKAINYLQNVDEYSTRARTANSFKKAIDLDDLNKYFTNESVRNLINKVWSISPYIVGGTSLYKLNKRKNKTN